MKTNITYQYYPRNEPCPDHLKAIVNVFQLKSNKIHSSINNLHSNQVLGEIAGKLKKLGFEVEASKTDTIEVPVIYGLDGTIDKSFKADAFSSKTKTVVEVEAGRAVKNYQFLKDLFQACMMHDVDYLVIAVRIVYGRRNDFQEVCKFFEALFTSQRLHLPMKGILIIGY